MLANERTANEGMGNFKFYHHDDLLDTEKYANDKLVDVLESEDKANQDVFVYVVDCFEKKASWFEKNVISIRNASDINLKVKLDSSYAKAENDEK